MDRAPFLDGLRRVAPYATLLGIGLGLVVGLGAQLSHAYPSAARPFGWTGPSGFDNAVAMVRLDIVLATTLPALLAGALMLRASNPPVMERGRFFSWPQAAPHPWLSPRSCPR